MRRFDLLYASVEDANLRKFRDEASALAQVQKALEEAEQFTRWIYEADDERWHLGLWQRFLNLFKSPDLAKKRASRIQTLIHMIKNGETTLECVHKELISLRETPEFQIHFYDGPSTATRALQRIHRTMVGAITLREQPKRISKEELIDVIQRAAAIKFNSLHDANAKESLHKNILHHLQMNEYAQAIRLLAEMRDLNQGIAWHKIPLNGKEFVVRDAREVGGSVPTEAYYGFLSQTTNYAFALMKYMKDHVSDLAGNATSYEVLLTNLIVNMLTEMEQQKQKFDASVPEPHEAQKHEVYKKLFVEYNSRLIALAHDMFPNTDLKKLKKDLSYYRVFNSFDIPAVPLATLHNVKGKTYFDADIPLTGLTYRQRLQYEKRHKKAWYTSLPKTKQHLIDKNLDKLLQGDIPFPPLTLDIPGARNVTHRYTGYVGDDEKVDIFNDAVHAGALAHVGANTHANERMTLYNLEQVDHLTGDKGVDLTSYVSPNNPFAPDGTIDRLHRYATDHYRNASYTLLPINNFRRLGFNYYAGANQMLARAAEVLAEQNTRKLNTSRGIRKIYHYLHNNSFLWNWLFSLDSKAKGSLTDQLTRKVDPNLQPLIDAAIHCRYYMTHRWILFDRTNTNAKIAHYMHVMNRELRQLDSKNARTMISGCKSNIDRGGVVAFTNAVSETVNYHNRKVAKIENDKIAKVETATTLARGAHMVTRPGLINPGHFRIKTDTKYSFPKELGSTVPEYSSCSLANGTKGIRAKAISNNDILKPPAGAPVKSSHDYMVYELEKARETLQQELDSAWYNPSLSQHKDSSYEKAIQEMEQTFISEHTDKDAYFKGIQQTLETLKSNVTSDYNTYGRAVDKSGHTQAELDKLIDFSKGIRCS